VGRGRAGGRAAAASGLGRFRLSQDDSFGEDESDGDDVLLPHSAGHGKGRLSPATAIPEERGGGAGLGESHARGWGETVAGPGGLFTDPWIKSGSAGGPQRPGRNDGRDRATSTRSDGRKSKAL
jgi:hypothetical protein